MIGAPPSGERSGKENRSKLFAVAVYTESRIPLFRTMLQRVPAAAPESRAAITVTRAEYWFQAWL